MFYFGYNKNVLIFYIKKEMSKIMLVEDDPMIAEIYKKKFESAGFEVINAVTGKEVLKLEGESHFDLILLDMVLPEMSGMEVLKELKKSGKHSTDLKIIVFSNLDKIESEEEARENGADGFISKTQYTPTQLVEEISRLLKEYGEQKKNNDNRNGKSKEMVRKRKEFCLSRMKRFFWKCLEKNLKMMDMKWNMPKTEPGAAGWRPKINMI